MRSDDRAPDSIGDAAIAATLLTLIDACEERATICPSEVARALRPDDEDGWRALMPRVRSIAASLSADGRVRVTRKGEVVDAARPGGPIRIGPPR